MKRSISITAAAALAIPMLFMGVPAAVADDAASSSDYIVSTRSFPKVNTAKTDFFAEATSTDVEDDSNWGGLGSMDVPQTKSQAEKDAEKKAQEEKNMVDRSLGHCCACPPCGCGCIFVSDALLCGGRQFILWREYDHYMDTE